MATFIRVLAIIFAPPFAVFDKGCGAILLVCVLMLWGWVPGIIGAGIICAFSQNEIEE